MMIAKTPSLNASMRAVGISPTLKILGNRLCRLFLYLAKGDKVFQAAALTDDVMISPSFPRDAVRGFWPGLGAKSWAFAGIATIHAERCSSVAAIQVLHSRSYADKCYFCLGEWGCLNLHG